MTLRERALAFDCQGNRLVGIVSLSEAHRGVGVLIVVGGPQYRAGSHRQFVQLARALAAADVPTLRFDYRGMGDSEGELRHFDSVDADIDAAIGALLGAVAGLQRVVIWGLCDGASAALMYLQARPDARVAGLVLVNPWARSQASLAKTHVKHYYLQRLGERAFWSKLLRGGVALEALTGLVGNLRAAFGRNAGTPQANLAYQHRMAQGWASFAGPRLLILSEHDLTAREFIEYIATSKPWQTALARRDATRIELRDADHTCSQPAAQRALERATTDWLTRSFALASTHAA